MGHRAQRVRRRLRDPAQLLRQPTFTHGSLSTYAGSGFKAVYLSEDPQARLRDDVIIPAIQEGDVGRGLIAAVDEVDAQITPARVAELQLYRTANALVGIPGSRWR